MLRYTVLRRIERLRSQAPEPYSYLRIAERLFGTRLSAPAAVRHAFRKITPRQFETLTDDLHRLDHRWTIPPGLGPDTLHLGRGYDQFNFPSQWSPESTARAFCRQTNPATIRRLLVYAPYLSVWIQPIMYECFPSASPDDREAHPLCEALCNLAELDDAVAEGSLTLIPDSFYAEVCNTIRGSWAPMSAIEALSHREAGNPALREILGQIDHFADQCEGSESRFNYEWGNRELHTYVGPLIDINEDIAVQTVTATSSLAIGRHMFEVMRRKFGDEAITTKESVWSRVHALLPALRNLNHRDLASVRANEVAFHAWRTSLSSAIRAWNAHLVEKGSLTEYDATRIFQESTLAIRHELEGRIATRTLRANLESNGVTFAAGAIAACVVGQSVTAGVATGAASTSLKLIYDLLKSRNQSVNRSLVRLYASFDRTR